MNKKLKQERRVDLFKSLAASQDTLTSSLQLQPSSSLGSRQFRTNQDKLDKVSTLSERRRTKVFDQIADKKRGYHSDSSDEDTNGDDSRGGMPLEAEGLQAGPSRTAMKSATRNGTSGESPLETQAPTSMPSVVQPVPLQPIVLGSALVRGPDGEVVKPVIRQRQKKAPRVGLLLSVFLPSELTVCLDNI